MNETQKHTPSNDLEVSFRVGRFRVHFYPTDGGMSVESFSVRHNGHPQGDWLVAHDEEHDAPDCAEALRLAYEYRARAKGVQS